MKIPNHDNNKNKQTERKLNDSLSEAFRMLICEKSNCGKTNLLMHLLRQPIVYCDEIYYNGHNPHQEKIQHLILLMNDISSRVGYNVLNIGGENDILDTIEYNPNNRSIVVFHDLVNASDKIQNKISNHFTDGRHHKISPVYLSQSYYDVPQKLRQNCSHMVLYPPTTKNHANLIAKENNIDPNLFKKLGPHEFFFVDKEHIYKYIYRERV